MAITVQYVVAGSRWWRSDTVESIDAWVTDMSMTGVGVIAHRNVDLHIDTIVTLEIRGASAEAIIRRMSDVDSTWGRYGLEYRPLNAEFHEVVSDLVAPMHKDFAWQWTVAR